jgi:hypothetical protein
LTFDPPLCILAATLQERKPVKASCAFIHADVNTYCPSMSLESKENTHKNKRNAATHGDVKASCTTTTSK